MAAGGKAGVDACSVAGGSERSHGEEILLVHSNGRGYMEGAGIHAERFSNEDGF